jgi:tetratricopeptide (TPR) repeat protein
MDKSHVHIARLVHNGYYEVAARLSRAVLVSDPTDEIAWFLLACALSQQRTRSLREIRNCAGNGVNGYAARWICVAIQTRGAGIENLPKLLATVGPRTTTRALKFAARALILRLRHGESLELLKQAESLGISSWKLSLIQLCAQGTDITANSESLILNNVQRLGARDADIAYALGQSRYMLGRYEEAEHHFRCAIHERPNWLDPRIEQGYALASCGRWTEAWEVAQLILRVNPESDEAKALRVYAPLAKVVLLSKVRILVRNLRTVARR